MIINFPTYLYKPTIDNDYISLTVSSTLPIKNIEEIVPFINIQLSSQIEMQETTGELIEISISNSNNIDSSEFFNIDDVLFTSDVLTIPQNISITINNKKNIYGAQYLDQYNTELLTNLNANIT